MSRGMLAALLAACGLLFFAGLGRPGLFEQDEPRYAETARAMARGGDWLVPRFNGRERLEKPPGTYWAMAASFRATGREDEGAARLPSAIAATATVLLVAFGAGRALGPRWGAFAGLALATMLQFLVQARLATTDMLFTLAFTAAAATLVPALEGGPRAPLWILASGIPAGLAALVKTPLALVLPALASLGTSIRLRRGAGWPARLAGWVGSAALCGAIFGAWYLLADRATEGRLRQQIDEEMRSRVEVHLRPFWWFALLLPAAAFPWSLLVPAGVAAAWRERAALPTYAMALAAAVLLCFSAIPSKLPSYLLPALPALAVLAACGARALVEDPGGPAARLGRAVAGWGGIAFGIAFAVAPWVPAVRAEAPGGAGFALGGALLAGGGMLLLWGRPRGGLAAFACLPLALGLLAPAFLARIEEEKCARHLVEAMRAGGLAPGDRIFDAGNSLKGVPWYADRATETRPDGDAFPEAAVTRALGEDARTWAIFEHDPAEARAEGRRTQWERVLGRLPPGAPLPRVVYRGLGRIVVTSAPLSR